MLKLIDIKKGEISKHLLVFKALTLNGKIKILASIIKS